MKHTHDKNNNPLITCSEKHGEQPFDWYKFLNKESYTNEELEDAEDRAGDWVTCACGNLCSVIPRDDYNEPLDHILNELGIKFSEIIEKMAEDAGLFKYYREIAKVTLDNIEDRSTEILIEMGVING